MLYTSIGYQTKTFPFHFNFALLSLINIDHLWKIESPIVLLYPHLLLCHIVHRRFIFRIELFFDYGVFTVISNVNWVFRIFIDFLYLLNWWFSVYLLWILEVYDASIFWEIPKNTCWSIIGFDIMESNLSVIKWEFILLDVGNNWARAAIESHLELLLHDFVS